MKILALGDPHSKLPRNLDAIIKKNEIDVIVCVGDIGFVPKKPWLQEAWDKAGNVDEKYEKYVDKIASYNLPVLTLRGDTYIEGGKKIADRFLRKHKNVINKFTGKYNLNGQNFVFFDISFESETMIRFFVNKMRRNENRELKLNKMLSEDKNSIIISHNPPYGVVDKISIGKHVGSKILQRAIKKYQPKMVLCGHIHEAEGEGKIGKTKIYNLGSHGKYKILEV